ARERPAPQLPGQGGPGPDRRPVRRPTRRRAGLMRLAVIGAGSWGTTVAALGARNAEHVTLWARRPELAEAIATAGENPDYLPGRALGAVAATARLDEALDGAD